jgi:hypothetical protein
VFANTPQEQSQIFNRQLTAPPDNSTGYNVADVTYPAGTITETFGTRAALGELGAAGKD